MKPDIVFESVSFKVWRSTSLFEPTDILTNHPKTSAPEFDTFKNARQPMSHVTITAAYGTPRLLVRPKNIGACPFKAML